MKKILFLEDRPGRQEQYLTSEGVKNLQSIEGVKRLLGKECREMIEQLNNNDDSPLNEFTLLLIHRSALSPVGIDTVINHCKNNNKNLVFFSGGISQSLFSSENFPYLMLNSKDFYQRNMSTFLRNYVDEKSKHITELIYGTNWDINLMLTYRQLLLKGEMGRAEENFKESLEELIGKPPLGELNKKIESKILLL